jgi:hypothetical protein
MVTFTRIHYHKAIERAEYQDKILLFSLCATAATAAVGAATCLAKMGFFGKR